MLQQDESLKQNRLKFRKDNPKDWRAAYEPWAYDNEDEWMEAGTMPRASMSFLLKVHEAPTEADQRALMKQMNQGGGA